MAPGHYTNSGECIAMQGDSHKNNETPARLMTHDCEEFNSWSSAIGWDTDYRQLGCGSFSAWYEPCISHDLRIGSRYTNREIVVTGTPPEGCIPLILPLNTGEKGHFQGRPLGTHNALLMCPGSEAIYRSPDNCHIVTISIPETRIRQALESSTQVDASALTCESRAFTLPEFLVRLLQQSTANICQLNRSQPNKLTLSELEDHVITAMALGMAQAFEVSPNERARCNHLRYVKSAQDFIEANLQSPLGLETLSRETLVSVRSLQYAFNNILGMPPLHYIKTRRLLAIHQRLHRASPSSTSVTQLANDFGFSHLGYFARDYRACFDETPSETLMPHRRRH
jgi:AraC family ethanolamine operon transcriptional activator